MQQVLQAGRQGDCSVSAFQRHPAERCICADVPNDQEGRHGLKVHPQKYKLLLPHYSDEAKLVLGTGDGRVQRAELVAIRGEADRADFLPAAMD